VGDAGVPIQARKESGAIPHTPVQWDDRLEEVLEQWHRRVWASQLAHYRRASQLRRSNIALGLPVVVLTAIVGTSLFATLNESRLPLSLRIVVGSISVGAAVLSAIQTFFGFAQRADRHVLAADWYAALRRKIEELQALPRQGRGDARKVLDDIRREMNTVSSQFPQIGERDWHRAAKEFGIGEPPRRPRKPEPRADPRQA
jgi:hypothetical protein